MIASQNSDLFTQFLMSDGMIIILIWRANGVRYPRVGRTRGRHFAGTNFKPETCRKTRRLPPVGCTLCWAGFIHQLVLEKILPEDQQMKASQFLVLSHNVPPG